MQNFLRKVVLGILLCTDQVSSLFVLAPTYNNHLRNQARQKQQWRQYCQPKGRSWYGDRFSKDLILKGTRVGLFIQSILCPNRRYPFRRIYQRASFHKYRRISGSRRVLYVLRSKYAVIYWLAIFAVASIQVPPRPSCPSDNCKNPIQKVAETQLATLDPAGEREALFNRKNREGIKPGDILRVTFKTGEPFAGVCLNVRSRGIDTGFLLRNKLTKLSVEMWIKGYSPNVQSVEIVQRREKRARRARLTYMRFVSFKIALFKTLFLMFADIPSMMWVASMVLSGNIYARRLFWLVIAKNHLSSNARVSGKGKRCYWGNFLSY